MFSNLSRAGGAIGQPLLIGFAVTLVMTLALRKAAIAMRWYDLPDGGLKPHTRPIPYMGGIAMLCGWGAVQFVQAYQSESGATVSWIVALGGVMMAITGLVDDRIHLRPRTRLLLEAMVAVILAFGPIGRGMVMALANATESLALRSYSQLWPGPVATAVILVVVLTYTTNATNLIDGLDGLCAGVCAIMGAGYLLLVMALQERGIIKSNDAAGLLTLCAAQIAICLGFLVFNFNPASIFMGDSGSLLLGYNVAVILAMLGDATSPRWVMAGIVIFGFPILDTTLAIVRRWKNRRPLFVGDRSHLYDQLRDRGLTVKKTALVCYAIGAAFAGLGLISLMSIATGVLICVYVGLAVVCAAMLTRFGMLRVDDSASRSAVRIS